MDLVNLLYLTGEILAELSADDFSLDVERLLGVKMLYLVMLTLVVIGYYR
jgi:hypothetical protein